MKEQSQRGVLPNNYLPVLQVIKTCINCNTHPALLECLNSSKVKILILTHNFLKCLFFHFIISLINNLVWIIYTSF